MPLARTPRDLSVRTLEYFRNVIVRRQHDVCEEAERLTVAGDRLPSVATLRQRHILLVRVGKVDGDLERGGVLVVLAGSSGRSLTRHPDDLSGSRPEIRDSHPSCERPGISAKPEPQSDAMRP